MTSPGRLLLPLSTSRTFIPLEDISTVIINEGLTRWNVRYYLGIVSKGGRGVDVAYDVSPGSDGWTSSFLALLGSRSLL